MNDKIFLALVIWVGLSLPLALDWTKSLREFFWILESFLIFYMISHADLKRNQVERLLRAWCYGAVVVSSIALLQYGFALRSGQGAIRVNATLGAYNSLAGYLIVYIPIIVSLMYGKRKDQRIFWGILVTLMATALFATYTRAGWYAAILSILVLARLLKDKKLLVLLLLYIFVYVYGFPEFGGRNVSDLYQVQNVTQDGTFFNRIQYWKVALKMWTEHPLMGVGVGNFYHLHDTYIAFYPSLSNGFPAMEPHNSFMKFLAEQGTIGLLLFLSLLLSIFKKLVEGIRDKGNDIKTLSMGAFAGYIAFLVQSNSNSLFQDPRVAFGMWLVLGLMIPLPKEQTVKMTNPKSIRPSIS